MSFLVWRRGPLGAARLRPCASELRRSHEALCHGRCRSGREPVAGRSTRPRPRGRGGGGRLPSPCDMYPDVTYRLSAWALGPDSLGSNSVLPLNAHVTLHVTPPGLSLPIHKMAVAGLRTAHDSEDLCGGRQTHAQLPRLAPGSPAAARMGAVTGGPNAAVALTCLRRCHMTERERNGYPRASAGWDGPTAALPAGGANRFLPVPAR